MEWLALILWVLVAMVALPLGRHALTEHPALGLQAMAGLGGLALCVLFLATDRPPLLAWAAVALGVLGGLAVAVAAYWLVSDNRYVSAAGEGAEEIDALLTAVAGPLFAIAVVFSIPMAIA